MKKVLKFIYNPITNEAFGKLNFESPFNVIKQLFRADIKVKCMFYFYIFPQITYHYSNIQQGGYNLMINTQTQINWLCFIIRVYNTTCNLF